MNPNLNEIVKLAKVKNLENKKYFVKLKNKPPKNLDLVMQDLHDNEFKKTDCLEVPIVVKPLGHYSLTLILNELRNIYDKNHNNL